MKSVYLIRHAKSSWEEAGLEDHERPLNEKGFEDAPIMAAFLAYKKVRPNLILCSTSKRTKQTYSFFAEYFKGVPLHLLNTLYHASAQGILEQIRLVSGAYKTVFVFCHNPGIENFINKINGKDYKIPTCAVAEISINTEFWRQIDFHDMSLVNLTVPKDLKE